MTELIRKTIDSLLPEGSAWTVAKGLDLDKFYEGKADSYDDILEFLGNLAKIRDPQLTTLLDELEREYGITKNDSLTEQQRRDFLSSIVFRNQENGTPEELQRRLEQAGFTVQVHANDPAVDPLVVLDQAFKMVAAGPNAYAGRPDAFARRLGGELIVNGDKFKEVPDYLNTAGGANAFAGRPDFLAGVFDELESVPIEYPIPSNPADWPLLFFVGGDATKDLDGKITKVDVIIQPAELRNEYIKILVKYKPLHTWCISVVDFV